MVLDLGVPYNPNRPPSFVLPKDRDLLKSAFGDGGHASTSFDSKKVKEEVTLGVDQLDSVISALTRTFEVILLRCPFSLEAACSLTPFLGCQPNLREDGREAERDCL